MPEMAKARRAQGDVPRGRLGRWRCFLCDGPNPPWRPSYEPAQAVAYHRARYHARPYGGPA